MRTKLIAGLLAAAVAGSAVFILLQRGRAPAPVARISRDGVLLEEIDLSRVDEPYSLTLEDESGRNVLSVERGRVCVSEADCPDQVCVKQGWVSSGAAPIVCLPHKLVVELAGTGEDLDGGAG
jgi:hypothetical protein